jgi:hypothetical protein
MRISVLPSISKTVAFYRRYRAKKDVTPEFRQIRVLQTACTAIKHHARNYARGKQFVGLWGSLMLLAAVV